MQEIRVSNQGIELQVRDYGHTGEAILFLHFSGANLMMWERVVPFFQDQYRVLLMDLRGHGKSDAPEGGYHMDVMAEDVITVLDQLGIGKAHIVGSSLGAEVGLSLAANHPERVISLILDGAMNSEYGPYGLWEGTAEEFDQHVTAQLEKIRNAPGVVLSPPWKHSWRPVKQCMKNMTGGIRMWLTWNGMGHASWQMDPTPKDLANKPTPPICRIISSIALRIITQRFYVRS